jgi:hypothetical protein
MTWTDKAPAHDRVYRAGALGRLMSLNMEDEVEAVETTGPTQELLAPYLALDRLLRYARSEALSQHREKTASLIEAAIISLPDTSGLSRH